MVSSKTQASRVETAARGDTPGGSFRQPPAAPVDAPAACRCRELRDMLLGCGVDTDEAARAARSSGRCERRA